MQKARQAALVQETNQGLVQIRGVEISYYTSFYCSFGCQAAIIIGFAYSALTQIDVPINLPSPVGFYDPTGFQFIGCVFWISSAVCMCAGMHCVMTTIFISVLGPGLALHGPQGSMAKAADGMRLEVNQVFLAFNTMVIAFAISVLASCWVLMDLQSAIISTTVLCICSYFWYRSCRRIVNRFQYNFVHTEIDFDSTDHAVDENIGDNSYAIKETSEFGQNIKSPVIRSSSTASAADSKLQQKFKSDQDASITSKPSLFGIFRQSQPTKIDHNHGSKIIESNNFQDELPMTEGYLTINEDVMHGKEVWKRRYCVIGKSGVLFFYENKTTFKETPGKPLKNRPIDLASHSIQGYAEQGFFNIRLVPEDSTARPWILKCDSPDEQEMWLSSFHNVVNNQ